MAAPLRQATLLRRAGIGSARRARDGRAGLIVPALLWALAIVLAPTAAARAAPPSGALANDFAAQETEHVRFVVQKNDRWTAPAFAAKYGGAAERAYAELSVLFNAKPAKKIDVFVYVDATAFGAAVTALNRNELGGVDAIADPVAGDVSIALARFGAHSDLEAENALRHAVSHLLVGMASGRKMPHGFDEGIAQYVERPINPKIARIAALVQNASQGGKLVSWSDMNRPQPPVDAAEIVSAQAYSVVSFLIDRYGLQTFQKFLVAMQTSADWRDAMRTSFNRDPREIEKQWRENVPRWVTTGWKVNLVAAFDLQPARDLLRKANYAGAKTALERSQRLYTELNDAEQLKVVSDLIAQCDTGIQAEALMTQTQQALEHHTYDRAASLLMQAKAQYDRLPTTARPDDLIATYDSLAQAGTNAAAKLDEAVQLSHSWGDYPAARTAAVDAGKTFARLGDDEMTNRARSLLSDLDSRQRRLVLLLGALAVLTLAWLALWLWARGASELEWD